MGDSAPPKAHAHPILAKPIEPTVPAASTPEHGAALPPEDQFDAGSALLRLLIGGMLVGADELRERLRRWDEHSLAPDAVVTAPPQTASASMRRAAIGAAFEAQARMRRRFSTMMTRFGHVADDANLVYTRLALAVRGTPLEAARGRLDELLFLTLSAVDRWTERGQREERHGRQMTEQAVVSVIDELLDYMARNPEVRKLIEQQGTSIADSAVEEVRERTASADQWIERLAHNLLHRPLGDKPTGLAGTPGTHAPLPPPAPPPAANVSAPPAAARARTRTSAAPARAPSAAVTVETAPSTDSE